MRFDAEDALRRGERFTVTLDGVVIDHPIWANDELGQVKFAPCGKDGKPYFSNELSDFIIVTARGKVTITRVEPVPCAAMAVVPFEWGSRRLPSHDFEFVELYGEGPLSCSTVRLKQK